MGRCATGHWLRHFMRCAYSASVQAFNSNPFELVTLSSTAKKESPERGRAPTNFLTVLKIVLNARAAVSTLIQFSKLHVLDDQHPISTSMLSCSSWRSLAPKESTFTQTSMSGHLASLFEILKIGVAGKSEAWLRH